MTAARCFRDDLAFANDARLEDLWRKAYLLAFPDLVTLAATSRNGEHQRRGVDRLIYLPCDKILRVDEKLRRGVYDDVLLEFVHRETDGTAERPGWIEKDLPIDYLAYAFLPARTVYLFPWQELRRAWRRDNAAWRARYRIVCSHNAGQTTPYDTYCVAVPIPVLLDAMRDSLHMRLKDDTP